MNLLDNYRSAGVLTFTVRNKEAIAVNPYAPPVFFITPEQKSKYWKFKRLNLPPLPTSGIPDGTVKIEDVEEEARYFLIGAGWIKCKSNHPHTYYRLNGIETRTALIPKALRKGEEEKPEIEMFTIVDMRKSFYAGHDLREAELRDKRRLIGFDEFIETLKLNPDYDS